MSFLCCCRRKENYEPSSNTELRMTLSRHLSSLVQSQAGIADIDGLIEKWEAAITNYADVSSVIYVIMYIFICLLMYFCFYDCSMKNNVLMK